MHGFCPANCGMDGEPSANEAGLADHLRTNEDFQMPHEDDLYFIQAHSGPVKIGRAKDARKRLLQCRTGSHEGLDLIGVVKGCGYAERVWHTAFQDTRLKGEWFEHDDELREAIRLALDGEDWWHHLSPPLDFDLSDDPEEYDDDVVDWHIAIQMALTAARAGDKPPLNDPNELAVSGQDMVLRFLDAAARRSWVEPNHQEPA